MQIRILLIFTLYLAVGCASTPRYTSSSSVEEKEFKDSLEYSRKIFNQPIDILLDDFTSSIQVTNSGDKQKSNLFSNVKHGFGVQIASFRSKQNADNYLLDLKTQHVNLRLNLRFHDGLWRVVSDLFKSRAEAENLKALVHFYGYSSAWIIKF